MAEVTAPRVIVRSALTDDLTRLSARVTWAEAAALTVGEYVIVEDPTGDDRCAKVTAVRGTVVTLAFIDGGAGEAMTWDEIRQLLAEGAQVRYVAAQNGEECPPNVIEMIDTLLDLHSLLTRLRAHHTVPA